MRPTMLVLALLACAAGAPVSAHAATTPAPKSAARSAPKSERAAPPAEAPGVAAAKELGLAPALPANYSVDMTIHADGKDLKMTRWTNENGDMRMDIDSKEHGTMTMIQLNDEAKTMYTVVDERKEVMKQSLAHAMKQVGKGAPDLAAHPDTAQGEADATIELVGHEDVNGVAADKYKITSEGMTGYVWMDPKTRLLARMQADNGTVDFTNYKVGATTAEALAPPKDYKLTDMDEMMAKMGGMGGGGMGGMLGGVGRGMVGGMGAGLGGNLGGAAGGTLGGMLGGPLGRMAGQYLGNKLGAKLGGKVAGGAAGKL